MTLNDEPFWQHVDKTDGCWMWTGPTTYDGYGAWPYKSRVYTAHRLTYEDAQGEIPADLVIHHVCENKLCVNPAHLQAVTRSEHSTLHAGVSHNAPRGRVGSIYALVPEYEKASTDEILARLRIIAAELSAREGLVMLAKAKGAPISHIAKATGLTRQAIYNILGQS